MQTTNTDAPSISSYLSRDSGQIVITLVSLLGFAFFSLIFLSPKQKKLISPPPLSPGYSGIMLIPPGPPLHTNSHNYKLNILIIKCLNQIISKNKPYNLRLCTFTFHKFQEKNLNLNRDTNSDLQIRSLALCHWAILVLFTGLVSNFSLEIYVILMYKDANYKVYFY